MKKSSLGISLLLTAALLVSGCGSNAVPDKAPAETKANAAAVSTNGPKPLSTPVTIKIGYPTQGASMLPLWVAKDAGLFEKYGIKAELVYIAGTPKVQETLNGGAIEVGLTGVDPVGKSKAIGRDSVIISAVSDRNVVYVYGQKNMNPSSYKNELKGKTLITAAEGSLYDHLAQSFIKEQGLTPKTDVKLLHMGGEGDRTAAFLKGEGAFYVVAPPTSFKMDELGYPKLYDFTKMEVLLAGVVMSKEYLDKNPDVAKAVVGAMIEANALIVNDKAVAIKSIIKWTGVDDKELAAKTYEVNVGAIPKKPYVTEKAVQFFLNNSVNEKVRQMKPSDLVDDRIVKALDESGWIDSLYKK